MEFPQTNKMEIGVVKEHGCCHLHLADSMQQLVAGWIIESHSLKVKGFGMKKGGFESVESVEASIGSYTSSKYIISMKQFPSKIRPKLYIPENVT